MSLRPSGSNPLLHGETSSPLGIGYPTSTMSQRALETTCKRRRGGSYSPLRGRNCARSLGGRCYGPCCDQRRLKASEAREFQGGKS